MIWSLLAAAGMAVTYGVATVLQAVAARRASGLSAFRQPLALAGIALDGVAWLLSLVAVSRLPLFVVQAIQAAQLVIIVVLAGAILHARVRRAEAVAIGATMAALVVLALAAGDQPAETAPRWFAVVMAAGAAVLVVAAVVSYRKAPSWWLAVLAGLGYSATALAARAAQGEGWRGFMSVLGVVLVVSGAVAIICYLRALEGNVGTAAAILVVLEVLIPGVVGLAFLGDEIRPGWMLICIAAVVVAIVGCGFLAMSPANTGMEGAGASHSPDLPDAAGSPGAQ